MSVTLPAPPAMPSPTMPSDRGTPPVTVHSTPAPAQVMHSSTLRRLKPFSSARSKSFIFVLPERVAYSARDSPIERSIPSQHGFVIELKENPGKVLLGLGFSL